jgi:hypothetical protein
MRVVTRFSRKLRTEISMVFVGRTAADPLKDPVSFGMII